MKINKIISETRKFIKFDNTIERGIICLGKFTFLIRLALSTMEPAEISNDWLKKYQGNKAMSKKIGYFSICIFINKEKTTESITIINNGFNRLHNIPNPADLYLTLKSFIVKFRMSSL
jgi:hypothetical protein